MHIKIESIDQKMMLNEGAEIVTFLTLVLPNGDRVNARVDPSTAQTIIELATLRDRKEFSPVTQEDESPHGELLTDVFSAPSDSSEDEEHTILWNELPDEHLSPKMKIILTEMGVPPSMPASAWHQLVGLIDEITEKMLANEMAQQPQVGKVQRPGHLQVTRAKTVPKNDAGYPILPVQNDRDPGELAQMGSDEDGVPQL